MDANSPPKLSLRLADNTILSGVSFGASTCATGEVVFNTGMTGYVETLTDPSYFGQILVLTYPIQGNYGVLDSDLESLKIQVSGLVVHHYSESPSHYGSTRSLGQWLREHGIPAIHGVDTRALTRRLRDHGTMLGTLSSPPPAVASEPASSHRDRMRGAVRSVVTDKITRHAGGEKRVLLIDTGAKDSIVSALQTRGATVIRAPAHLPWENLLPEVGGVLVGNGPGDPADCAPLIARLRLLFDGNIPVFGICLGHQLLALAAGASTYKLKFGHRSQNQPVEDCTTGRGYLTSQNHGYAVEERSLQDDWKRWFVNLNDGTNEGVRHRSRPFFSVQFHPEAAAGPNDTMYLFDEFLSLVHPPTRTVTA